ncbi:MAG: DUF1800 domain-containing protein [Longimicrobiales bacterium]
MRIGSVHRFVRMRVAWFVASVVTATVLPLSCVSSGASSRSGWGSLSSTEQAIHLLSRATYGVRQQDVEEVLRIGADDWIDRQLDPSRIADNALEERLERMSQDSRSVQRITIRRAPPAPGRPDSARTMQFQQQAQAMIEVAARMQANALPALVTAKLQRAIHSERQLEEVMTDFWFNHFNVFFNKGQVRLAVADYEENAIRRHVFGRFEDMLIATAQHPAMLVYLDNFMSTALTQQQRGQRGQRGGLNENYARELLELHTLGVDGGYTQQDVIEVARAFTGWTILTTTTRPNAPEGGGPAPRPIQNVSFRFDPERHDGGEKVVLGRTLPAGGGMEDGLEILRMLAAHPSTAQHIARKLVRHFVSDDPPERLVEDLARVFRSSGGNLRAVTRALFTSKEFYRAEHFRAKARRPFEFVAGALRVTGAEVQQNQALIAQLRAFGHLPYSEPAPTGYPTVADEWLSAGAMLARINFALELAAGRVGGVAFEPVSVPGHASTGRPASADSRSAIMAAVLNRYLYGVAAEQLTAAITEDLALQTSSAPRALTARAIGLVLGSPDFQRY